MNSELWFKISFLDNLARVTYLKLMIK